MGYLALLRNLRNFDEAGVPTRWPRGSRGGSDPAQVARSRLLPMRFLSAYRAAPSLRWGPRWSGRWTRPWPTCPRLRGRHPDPG